MSQQFKNVFSRIKQGEKSAKMDTDIDSILIQAQSSKEGLNEFTAAMADSEMAAKMKHIWDDSGVERWDLASTGGVANITPIFGYLWLMVAAEKSKEESKEEDKKYRKVVPKISTNGKGGGTIDILESGGLTFPSDPEAIYLKCKESGGVICQQDDNLTPIDKALMRRRRETNLMTNVYLTYASILSKKIAMRCTHAIIDVKLGKDTKILSAWMNQLDDVNVEKLLKAFDKDTLVISDKESLQAFANILQQLNIKTEEIDGDWIKQSLKKGNQQLYPLEEVRWLLTNANIPQCRVIGRQLMLIHLDQLINGLINQSEKPDGKPLIKDDLLIKDELPYKKLYCEVLPKICECNPSELGSLKTQWENLKKLLTKFDKFPAKLFQEIKKGKELELENSYSLSVSDLQVISFGLYPYQLQSGNKNVTIKAMDVQFLDELFSWLCGNEPYDPEVGIWLHKLPGETVEKCDDKPENAQPKNVDDKPENAQPENAQPENVQPENVQPENVDAQPENDKPENDKPKNVDDKPKNEDGWNGKRYLEKCNKYQYPVISIFYRPSRNPESEVIAKARQFLSTKVELNP
jgi:hypothetical protein